MLIIENMLSPTAESGTAVENTYPKSTLFAKRIDPRPLPKPQTLQQKMGLRYERKVVKALKARGHDLEHNSWFECNGYPCCPDIIIYELSRNRAIVIEVKLTYTSLALEKLKTLYCPVIEAVEGLSTVPLVICKHLTLGNNTAIRDFYTAINSPDPVYQWLGYGPLT